MTITVVAQGQEQMLDLVLAVGYTLRLYKTDTTAGLTEAQTDVLTEASFTEATFTGYASKALTGGSWVTTQADPSTGVYAQQTFTSTANQTAQVIYGYYITRTSDGKLVWFERFPGPLTISLNGDTIQITPTITLDDDQEATVAAQGIKAGALQVLTANSTGYTVTTVTDMTIVNFVADATRNYTVNLHSEWTMSVSTGTWVLKMRVAGAAAGNLDVPQGVTNGLTSAGVLWQPASGTYTLDIQAAEVAGAATFTLIADSVSPRSFWIEDVGPR